MEQERYKQIREFVTQGKKSGVSDMDIVKYMAKEGWLQELYPDRFGSYKIPEAVEPKVTPTNQKQGFFQRIADRFKGRTVAVSETKTMAQSGEITKPEVALQVGGQMAGLAIDVVGETINVGGALINKALFRVPEKTAVKVLEQPISQKGLEMLASGMDLYNEWAGENPRASRNLESVINIASIVPTKTAVRAASGILGKSSGAITTVGTGVSKSAATSQKARKLSMVEDLVSPQIKKTKLAKGKQLRDIKEGGILGQRRYAMESPVDKGVIKTVSEIPNIEKGNVLAKGKKMEQFIEDRAIELVNLTKQKDVIFPKKELVSRLNNVANELKKTPLFTGDAGREGQKLVNEYIRRINAADGKLSSVLKVRKDMDNWIKQTAGEVVLSGQKMNAKGLAVRELRNATNDYLITKSPVGSAVKKSLSDQSNVFRALDNVTPKALSEAGSSIERGLAVLDKSLGTRNRITQGLALAGGVGVLGAAAKFAPAITVMFGTALTGKGLYMAAVSPKTRGVVGKMLQGIGKASAKLPTTEKTIMRETIEVLIGLGIVESRELTDLISTK